MWRCSSVRARARPSICPRQNAASSRSPRSSPSARSPNSACRKTRRSRASSAWSKAAASRLQQRRPSRRACEMELKVTTLEGKAAGSVQLSDEIFGLEPRKDIIQRCVNWQLAKRQAGTHKTQGRADVWRTGKKMYKQKGTGGARHGSARVPQFRGGGRAFGPVVRSHAFALPEEAPGAGLC